MKNRRLRRVDPTAGLRIIARRQPVEQSAALMIESHARLALDTIQRGKGRPEDLHTLGFASNLSLLLAEGGYGPECLDEIKAAQAALLEADERRERTGRIGFRGPGLTALRELLEVYQQQIEAATAGDVEAALDELNRRIDAGIVARDAEAL